jgi:hypothetical protein
MKLLAIIICLVVIGITGCKKKPPQDQVLPGHQMSLSHALVRAMAVLPPATQSVTFYPEYKNGVWEISANQRIGTDGKWDGLVDNKMHLVARVQDADGKADVVKAP